MTCSVSLKRSLARTLRYMPLFTLTTLFTGHAFAAPPKAATSLPPELLTQMNNVLPKRVNPITVFHDIQADHHNLIYNFEINKENDPQFIVKNKKDIEPMIKTGYDKIVSFYCTGGGKFLKDSGYSVNVFYRQHGTVLFTYHIKPSSCAMPEKTP